MKNNIILIGAGGHCHSCIDTIEQLGSYSIAGIIDLPEQVGKKVLDYEVIGKDSDLPGFIKDGYNFLISIGQIKTYTRRKQLFAELVEAGAILPSLISPIAYVSPHAKIGVGTIIMPGAVVSARASVGQNCIINTMALIEHDVKMGDTCHIATGAIVNGNTSLGNESFIGSQAMIREGLNIGTQVIIGAGSNVFKDVPDQTTIKA